ncbi:hypothetical protein Ddye_021384 [Dipteronia dyeriana]|uniref:Uncharacterized protein n=1 Tax=Dipteronia dyeriana TaxID=168575 RepID=A0AAD9U2M1_9ROSI|nr:hypothetical protein Ddye_021384 [Dipteronia dyeriana]
MGIGTTLEFLSSIGKDTSTEMSQHAVMDIIIEYCNPKIRKKINFDVRLQTLLGRKSVNRNGVQKTSTMNSEIMLQVSNMVKEVPIHKLSDNDFSEEEYGDLCQKE